MIRRIIFHGVIVILIGLFALSPFIGAMTVGTIADHYRCQVDEGSVHPCIINGVDYGETFYTIGVLGWMIFFTIPVAGIMFLIYLVIVVLYYVIRGVNRRSVAKAGQPFG